MPSRLSVPVMVRWPPSFRRIARACSNSVRVCLRGERVKASRLLEESLSQLRGASDRWGITWALGSLGRVALDEHDYQRAEALFGESLSACRDLAGRKRAVAYALHYLGVVANEQRQRLRAAHLLAAAAAHRTAANAGVSPLDQPGHE